MTRSLPDLLADAQCRVPADVQKKAKAEWKSTAPPALFELVKKTFRSLKQLDHEVSEQLEALEQAVGAAKLAFDVVAFARAIHERSQHTSTPLATTYLFSRDAKIAREYMKTRLDTSTKTLDIGVSLPTLPDTFFDALPHLAFENLEVSVGELTSHRLAELMPGIRRISLSLGNTTLPPELFHDQLVWLTLRAKKLTEIPEAIGAAKRVWMLDIDAPKVKKLPKAMATLPLRSLSLTVGVPALDVSVWPTLQFLYLHGTIKSIAGLDKLPTLEDYKQRCGAKFPQAIWDVPTLKSVWIWFDGFDDFDEMKAKFEARGIEVAM
ncbi:MAG: hypothetical protein ABI867_41955 [Kofleriaceae bacterium]